MWKTWVWSLGWEDPLEKRKATPSSILAWRSPWDHRVGHNWATFTALWSYRFLPFSTLCFGSMSVSSGWGGLHFTFWKGDFHKLFKFFCGWDHLISPTVFFKKYLFHFYLAAWGLSCGAQDLWCSLWHARFLVVACELLVAAFRIWFPNQLGKKCSLGISNFLEEISSLSQEWYGPNRSRKY